MNLVEKHIINPSNPLYSECDRVCFQSKNIFNKSLYEIRKAYEEDGRYLNYQNLYHHMKQFEVYDYLPKKVFCWTLKGVSQAYDSYFALLKKKKEGKYNKDVNIPFYKHKTKGRYVTIYPKQALNKRKFAKSGLIKLSQTNIEIKTKIKNYDDILEVKISPKAHCYVIVVVYRINDVDMVPDNGRYLGIDLGLNNLFTIGSNVQGLQPVIINGKPLKAINQYYNKRVADLKSKLDGKQYTSKTIKKITLKRNNRVSDYMHKATRKIVNYAKDNNISKVIIGYNKEWKTELNHGKRGNQNFIHIPHRKGVDMLKYKLLQHGIELIEHEESYTSKCSFLDLEPVKKHEKYLGRRIKRGMFKSSSGRKINADVNGALNIMRKVIPNVFDNGIEGIGVHPKLLSVA